MTEAEKVGSAVGDDGITTREVYALVAGANARVRYWASKGLTEVRFSDGSGIIIGESGWDYAAGPDCLCWAGMGHDEHCEARHG